MVTADIVRRRVCVSGGRRTEAANLPRVAQARTAYASARSLLGSVPARICLPLVSPGLLGAGTSARMGTSQLRDGVCGDRPHYCVVAAVNDQNRVGGRSYGQDLLFALRMRDVPGPRIAEVLAEVDSHVRETGEDPREAFGPPKKYAAEVSATLGDPVKPLWRVVLSWSTAFALFTAVAGSKLILDGVTALSADERGVLGLPPVAMILLGSALLLAWAAEMYWLVRQPDTKVVDPRSGEEMTPSVPRWLLPVLVVGAPGVPLVLAVVLTITQR